MINWKNVFSEQTVESDEDLEARRNEMLQRLLSANKGVSKLSGKESDENSIESINEMMQNEMLMKMINSEVNTTPQIVGATQNGEEIVDFDNNSFVRAVQDRINAQEFEGLKSVPRDGDGKFVVDTSFTESTDGKAK
jgi:hypothetical protein